MNTTFFTLFHSPEEGIFTKNFVMKSFKIALGIVACALLFVSCDKNTEDPDTTDPVTGTDPINNSTWIYKVSELNEAGDTTSSSTTTLTATETSIEGSTWLKLSDPSGAGVIAMQKRSDGWWYMNLQGGSTESSLWYKTPASTGDTYPYIYGICTVDEVNASLTVSAGNFTDITHVEGHDDNSLEDEFWFTNTGAVLVKFDTYDAKSGQPESDVYKKGSWELVSFNR